MNNRNALIVKLDEHHPLVLEEWHVTFAPLVVNNRPQEQRPAWIVYQEDINPNKNKQPVLIAKSTPTPMLHSKLYAQHVSWANMLLILAVLHARPVVRVVLVWVVQNARKVFIALPMIPI